VINGLPPIPPALRERLARMTPTVSSTSNSGWFEILNLTRALPPNSPGELYAARICPLPRGLPVAESVKHTGIFFGVMTKAVAAVHNAA